MTRNHDQYLVEVWNQLITYLNESRNIEPEVVNSFYSPCSLYELTEEKAIILAPSVITKQILQNEVDMISHSLIDVLQLDHPLLVEIYIKSELPSQQTIQENINFFPHEEQFSSLPIREDRTFDSFVVGDCNRESHAAALACAINPGKYKFCNPLFIYGNSGLGKTHLLMAIANYVKKTDPTKKVYYTEAPKFVENIVDAITNGYIDSFKRYMYSVDLLLVDDIQFLADKPKSHEIFFMIYEELINSDRQVCIASDRQPTEIKGLQDRLITRFSGGLSVGIDSPEFETSLAILKKKIASTEYGIEEIEEEGLDYIASNFSNNIRELEGAWNRVLFYAIEFQPDGGIIRFETVMNALKNQAVVSDKTGLSPRKIIKAVSDYYGLTRQQITSKTRTKNISNARHISIYLCRKLLDLPYIKIGEEFGGRDHSTVISACTKVEQQIKTNPSFANAIKEIEKQIG